MYTILINPASSSGQGKKVWDRIKTELEKRNVPYEAHLLTAPGEAGRLTRELTGFGKSEETHLLVLGGDGTLNEVINGIQDFEHTTLSCLRTGSGNDFAGNAGVEKDPVRALLHLLQDPEERRYDFGRITLNGDEGRRFLISCGAGYDADICVEADKSSLKAKLNKLGLGKLIYVLIGLKQIFSRTNCKAVLTLDDKDPMEISGMFFVVGMNHPCEGGGVPFCPRANPEDEMLDVCLVQDMPKLKLLLAVLLVYLKKHEALQNVTCMRCKKMKVVMDKPQWVHSDGEVLGQITELTWEVGGKARFVK